jgi:hypothetical protein
VEARIQESRNEEASLPQRTLAFDSIPRASAHKSFKGFDVELLWLLSR